MLSCAYIELCIHKEPFSSRPADSIFEIDKKHLNYLNKTYDVSEVIVHKFLYDVGAHDDLDYIKTNSLDDKLLLFSLYIYNDFVINNAELFCDFVGYNDGIFFYVMYYNRLTTNNKTEFDIDYIVFDATKIHAVASNCGLACVTVGFNS